MRSLEITTGICDPWKSQVMDVTSRSHGRWFLSIKLVNFYYLILLGCALIEDSDGFQCHI